MLNTEQTLTRVLQIVHALDEDETAIYTAVSKNPYEWESAVGPIPQLYFLEQDLRRTLVRKPPQSLGAAPPFSPPAASATQPWLRTAPAPLHRASGSTRKASSASATASAASA